MRRKKFLQKILAAVFLGLSLILLSSNIYSEINEVYVIKLDDETINPITAGYIVDSIDKAKERNAECLIIELDTPGGLLTSTRQIVKKIMSSEVPVVVYVSPSGARAGSAGVFITYASHVAAMAPSTNIGAAHPINIGGGERSIWDAARDLMDHLREKESMDKDKEPEKKPRDDKDILGDKVLNDTVAFVKALAKERNRNIEWAEESVVESASITAKEALSKGVIEIIADSERDLLDKLDGKTVTIKGKKRILKTKNAALYYVHMNFRQRFLNILANPNIAYILMILGFYGLLFEVTHPGVGFPGVVGFICLVLAFFSMQTLPTNYAGVALIFLGIILFIAEVKVPGFGLPTLGGLVCMVLGSLLLFKSPYMIMRVSLNLIIAFTLSTAFITIGLVRLVIIAHRRKKISGEEGLTGEIGRAMSKIGPDNEGKIFVHGEIWNAVSKENISKGDKVKILGVSGLTLEVTKT